MLRKLIFTIVAFLVVVPNPVDAGRIDQEECDACREYHLAIPRRPIPATVPLFCLYFEQPEPDAVALLVYDKAGNRINAGNARHTKDISSTEGSFCIGRHYVLDAERIVLCNGVAHAVIDYAGIEWLTRWNQERSFAPWRTPPAEPIRIFPSGKGDPEWGTQNTTVPRN